jgi:hypothetical protein
VHDLRQQAQHYATDRDDHVANAKKALAEVIEPNRTSRANLSALQLHVEEIQKALEKLRKDNGQSALFVIFSATADECSPQDVIDYALCAKR